MTSPTKRAAPPASPDFTRLRHSSSRRADDRQKTHSGVQTEFVRWAKQEATIDMELRAFLGRAFNLKAIADYETGPGSKVTQAQAAEAIASAGRFVAAVEELICG